MPCAVRECVLQLIVSQCTSCTQLVLPVRPPTRSCTRVRTLVGHGVGQEQLQADHHLERGIAQRLQALAADRLAGQARQQGLVHTLVWDGSAAGAREVRRDSCQRRQAVGCPGDQASSRREWQQHRQYELCSFMWATAGAAAAAACDRLCAAAHAWQTVQLQRCMPVWKDDRVQLGGQGQAVQPPQQARQAAVADLPPGRPVGHHLDKRGDKVADACMRRVCQSAMHQEAA